MVMIAKSLAIIAVAGAKQFLELYPISVLEHMN